MANAGFAPRATGHDKDISGCNSGTSTAGREDGSTCGMSNLAWVGHTKAMSGKPAPEVTRKRWNRLKRDIGRCAVKVPPGGPTGTGKPEIWAF